MQLNMTGSVHRRRENNTQPVASAFVIGMMIFMLLGVLGFAVPAQAQTVSYTYDTGPNGIGHLTVEHDQIGTDNIQYNFTYDAVGRVIQRDQTVNGTTYTIRPGYDPAGRIQSIEYPDGIAGTINYSYNGPFLDTVSDTGTTYAQYGVYTPLGQPGTVAYGNGVTSTFTYSTSNNPDCPYDNYQLCTIVTSTASATYQQQRYAYDAVGNVKAIVDSVNGNQSFGYDELNRMTSAAGPYGTGGTAATLNYLYDPIGNTLYNSSVGFYTYPPSGAASLHPHAAITAGVDNYTYDNGGNMLTGAGRTMTYGPDNRLASVTSSATTFVYDDHGNRVIKTVSGTPTIYIGPWYECTGGSCTKFILAGSVRLALYEVGPGTVYYYHADLFGSSAVITDATGIDCEYLTYQPYGATVTAVNPIACPDPIDVHHKFTGHELDDSTGLYLFGSRYHDPVLTRFTSPDEPGGGGNTPSSLNRYSFMSDSPLSVPDPSKTPSVNGH
jgi:RHS repeat-associated protein